MRGYAQLALLPFLFLGAPQRLAQGRALHPAAASGVLSGTITDAVTQSPLAHVLITVGYLTTGFQRVAETDARGHYLISGLPSTSVQGIDTYAFAQGYFYHHGRNQIIRSGATTIYSYSVARDTFSVRHPRISSYYATPASGHTLTFGMVAFEGTGPFSFEMLAVSPQLGRLVVLAHGAGHHYAGVLRVPGSTPPGTYRFYYIATQNDCYNNKTFPYKDVHLS